MSLKLFEARALAATVQFLDVHGYRSEPLLGRLGIPFEMMKQGGWISINQFYDFVATSAHRVGCREAVLEAELAFFRLDHLGVISSALSSCKTVKEALDVATQMACKGYQGCRYSVDIRGETTWLSFSNPRLTPKADKFVDDITLGAFVHLLRSLIDDDWQPLHLRVQERKPDRHRGVPIFADCRIDFHPTVSGVAFPTEFLARRIDRSKQPSGAGVAGTWEWPLEDGEPFSDALFRLLASQFRYDEIPNLERIAKLVGLSSATLKRRLASTGINYRQLVDRLRFDTACEMLSIPEMSIKKISSELRYSGTNNFVRSFRRMTGVTPSEFRRQQLCRVEDFRG